MSQDTRAKISAACTGYRHTPEAIEKIRAASASRDTTKLRAAGIAARLGKPLSEAHREKLRAAKLGRKLSEDHRAKLCRKKGWKHTPEALAKIIAARRKRAARERSAKG